MSNIQVELLKDVSGELVPIDGINNDILTKCIKAGDISIDGDKLYGSDNFIIDAKRLKLTINKLNNNTTFNEAIESELLDTDNLITDSVTTTTSGISPVYPNFAHTIVRADDLHATLSDEVMWGNNYSDTENQTWSAANVNSGKLIIKSKLMVETLSASWRLQYGQRYSALSANVYNNMRNYRTVKIGDYYFDMFINTFIDAIARGMEIKYGSSVNQSNYGSYFVQYLNSIYGGLGTGCSNAINSFDGEYANCSINNLFVYKNDSDIMVHNDGYRRMYLWTKMCNDYISTLPIINVYQDGSTANFSSIVSIDVKTAIFMSSIMQYSWYESISAEYANLRTKLSLTHSNRTSYVIGYDCIDLLISNSDVLNSIEIGAGHTIKVNYNRVFESVKFDPIKFVYVTKYSPIKMGKCQIRSNRTETDSGIAITSNENEFDLTKLFVPCKRSYRYKSSPYYSNVTQFNGNKYKFILDNLNVENLFGDMSKKSMLVTSGFSSLNWLYFDNLECIEEPLTDNGNTHYDNIPIFDDISGTNADNYGLYMYADFFEKYYTLQKSNFLNIYIKVTIDGQLIYFGIVDYTTVSSNKKTISFEATDAIGVMIESIKKLSQMVSFAQFSSTNELIADTRSGSVIGEAIQEIIRTGHIYRTRLVNPDFVFPVASGLNNKLLADITMEDALILALQCSKKILMLDSNGLITIGDIDDVSGTTKTLSSILSREYNTEIYRDLFSIDKLKNIAGYNTFAPSVAGFFNSFRKLYRNNVEVKCYGIQSNINLLDKIGLDSKVYFVASRSFDIFNNESSFTLIEIGE